MNLSVILPVSDDVRALQTRRAVPGLQSKINDWLVPLRLERHVPLPWGMSLLIVGRKTRSATHGDFVIDKALAALHNSSNS